jgi:hypothetical protein
MAIVSNPQPHWMPGAELRDLGFIAAGPEIDYGMRWGEERSVRVSYAPQADLEHGFLYAYDKLRDRYLVLAAHTTPHAVQVAWSELEACTASPDAYLALASLDDRPLTLERARALLLHCLAGEFTAYREFIGTDVSGRVRVDAAHAVVVQRSARVSAEKLMLQSASAANPEGAPVVVRYRVAGERGWVGQVPDTDLNSAVVGMRRVADFARCHDLSVQATSVARGHATVAAARIPELEFVATPAPLSRGVPQLGL